MPQLQEWLEAQDQPATGDGLAELVERLRVRGYLSHTLGEDGDSEVWAERAGISSVKQSPGGHSLARIERLFEELNDQERKVGADGEPPQLVAGIGDDEQFAVAAALIARALGFESRVVLGVRLGGEEQGVPGVPACDGECRGEHLAAWIEVRDDDGAWRPVDVSPQTRTPPQVIEEGSRLPEFGSVPEERDAREVDPPVGTGERDDDAERARNDGGADWVWPTLRAVALSLAAAALIAAPLLFLPLAKRRRERRRRTAPDPELRALGAWQEMVDRADDAGVRIPDGVGRGGVAEALGTRPARWSAAQVDRAVFSPAGASGADAEWLWAAADADRAERRAAATRWERLRAAYSLRSYGVSLGRNRPRTEESAAAPPNGSGRGQQPSGNARMEDV
nr:transglutaminase domain-containing protein [Leucobacter weissii]